MFTLEFLKDIARLCSLSYDKQETIVENFNNSRPYNSTDNELVFINVLKFQKYILRKMIVKYTYLNMKIICQFV